MQENSAIKELYSITIKQTNTTEEYKELLVSYNELKEEYLKTLNQEQQKQQFTLSKLAIDMSEELNLQLFGEGFRLGVKLINEVYNNENKIEEYQ